MKESSVLDAQAKSPGTGMSRKRKGGAVKVSLTADTRQELHMRLILGAVVAFRDGDFSVRLPTDWNATEGQIASAFNQAIAQKQRISREVTRLSETVGKQGRLRQRMSL